MVYEFSARNLFMNFCSCSFGTIFGILDVGWW
jgi:hypothetical protein